VTFERVVPSGDQLFPYMWVSADDHTLFSQLLEENDALAAVEQVHQDDRRALYDVTWDQEIDGFLSCLRETEAIVLRAGGSDTAWEFELRFEDQEDIAAFQQRCRDLDIPITLTR
jgi:hypothetical protein